MASSFSVMAAKLGTVGEYCATVRSNCFVSISTSKPIQWLDCEENKHEVGLFDKQ